MPDTPADDPDDANSQQPYGRGESSQGRRGPRHALPQVQRWYIFRITIFTTGMFVILTLLFLGPRGSYPVSVLSLLVTFIFGFLNYLTAPPNFWDRVREDWRLTSLNKRVLNVLVFLALGGGAGWLVYFVTVSPIEIETAGSVVVEGGQGLTPLDTANIVFRDPIPDRENLGLSLKLVDHVGSGDCTTFATLTLFPMVGGAKRESIEVREPGTELRSGTETRIDLGGPTNDLKIAAKVNMDRGCKADLIVSKAVFYD